MGEVQQHGKPKDLVIVKGKQKGAFGPGNGKPVACKKHGAPKGYINLRDKRYKTDMCDTITALEKYEVLYSSVPRHKKFQDKLLQCTVQVLKRNDLAGSIDTQIK